MNPLALAVIGGWSGLARNWRSLLALVLAVVDVKYPGFANTFSQPISDAVLGVAGVVVVADRFAQAHEIRSKAIVITAQQKNGSSSVMAGK